MNSRWQFLCKHVRDEASWSWVKIGGDKGAMRSPAAFETLEDCMVDTHEQGYPGGAVNIRLES